MGIARDENTGLDVAERLCGVHGFAPEQRKSTGVFLRVVDPQHAVAADSTRTWCDMCRLEHVHLEQMGLFLQFSRGTEG